MTDDGSHAALKDDHLEILGEELVSRRSNLSLGRTLPRLLHDVGLTDVHTEVVFTLSGRAARRMQRTLIARSRDALVAAGLTTADDIERHLLDLDSADLDIAVFPIVSGWGRRQLDERKS